MKAGAVCVVHLGLPLRAPAACCLLLLVAAACCCWMLLGAAAPCYRSLLLAMGKGGEGLHNDCWGTMQYNRCHISNSLHHTQPRDNPQRWAYAKHPPPGHGPGVGLRNGVGGPSPPGGGGGTTEGSIEPLCPPPIFGKPTDPQMSHPTESTHPPNYHRQNALPQATCLDQRLWHRPKVPHNRLPYGGGWGGWKPSHPEILTTPPPPSREGHKLRKPCPPHHPATQTPTSTQSPGPGGDLGANFRTKCERVLTSVGFLYFWCTKKWTIFYTPKDFFSGGFIMVEWTASLTSRKIFSTACRVNLRD